jgi:hypothetical protein
MQIDQVIFEVLLVLPPRHAIHTRCRIPLEPGKGRPQQLNIDMVQQSREPFLLLGFGSLPYTLKSR